MKHRLPNSNPILNSRRQCAPPRLGEDLQTGSVFGAADPGNVPVGMTRLAGPWPEILRDCRSLGDVVTFVRRPGALLVSGAPVPELCCAPDGTWAASPERLLAVDFTRWDEVWELQEDQRRSVTVANPGATAGFGITFGPWTEAGVYGGLIGKYRVPGATPNAHEGPPVPWKEKLSNRAAWLRAQAPGGRGGLSPVLLTRVFEQALALGLTLRTGVCNDLVIHRPCWRLAAMGVQHDQVWSACKQAGLRIVPSELTVTWLVGGLCPCCGEDRLTVETYDRHDQLVLTLQMTNDDDEIPWRALLAGVCQLT